MSESKPAALLLLGREPRRRQPLRRRCWLRMRGLSKYAPQPLPGGNMWACHSGSSAPAVCPDRGKVEAGTPFCSMRRCCYLLANWLQNRNQLNFCRRGSPSRNCIPALRKSVKLRLPARAHAIIASAIFLRVSSLSNPGGIFLQTESSAAVIFAIVL